MFISYLIFFSVNFYVSLLRNCQFAGKGLIRTYIIEMDFGDPEFQKVYVHNFMIRFSKGLFWAKLALVTQPMSKLRPNRSELRSMDLSNQILCRFQKYKRKVPPPSPLFGRKKKRRFLWK